MSIHLLKSNALFLHIPKTGGTWVEEVLRECGIEAQNAKAIDSVTRRHSLCSHYLRRYRFIFAFVRHPVSWYESWWKFQAGHWKQWEPGVWHPQRVLEKCQSDDFSEFIRLCVQLEPAYVTRMFEWYLGPSGFEFVNFVGLCENLADDLVRVLRMLSYEFDEGVLRNHARANLSGSLRGEPAWDLELKEKVIALEAAAITRFYGNSHSLV